jgi:putative intracellular protease/amidase
VGRQELLVAQRLAAETGPTRPDRADHQVQGFGCQLGQQLVRQAELAAHRYGRTAAGPGPARGLGSSGQGGATGHHRPTPHEIAHDAGGDTPRAVTQAILIALTSHADLAGPRPTGYYLSEAAHPWRIFTDPVQQAFLDDERISAQLRATPRFGQVRPEDYDAVLFAGGHGTMWDFPHDPDLAAFTNSEEAAVGLTEAVPFLLRDRLVELSARHSAGPDFPAHAVTDGRLVTGQSPASAVEVAQQVLSLLGA